MEKIAKLINKLRQEKIKLVLNENDLEIISYRDRLLPEQISQIKAAKVEIIEYLKAANLTANVIPRIENQLDGYSLSNAQYRIWLACQTKLGSVTYNMPNTIILKGEYDIDKFEKAIKAVIDRHEILRTIFKMNDAGEVSQYILPSSELDFNLQFYDYKNNKEKEEDYKEIIELDKYKSFDLEKGPLIRAKLFQLTENQYVFYYNMHHIIGDGKSIEILYKDVLIFYNAFTKNVLPILESLQIQYKDYAVWQIQQLLEEGYKEHKKYWNTKFKSNPPLLNLPSELKRLKHKTNNGKSLGSHLSKESSTALKDFSIKKGGTLFTGVLAIWKLLLYKYTNEIDITVGNPVLGRNHAGLENQIGFYLNILPLRTVLNPNQDFNILFDEVKKTAVQGMKHQDYPFDQLLQDLNLIRDFNRNPLFDIKIDYHVSQTKGFDFSNSEILHLGKCMSKFDLEFDPVELADGGIDLLFKYNTDVYQEKTIERLALHYKKLVEEVLRFPDKNIGDFSCILKSEERLLLHDFNNSSVSYDKNTTIIDQFKYCVEKYPNACAVKFENIELTYKELDRKTNALAHVLINEYDVKPEMYVGTYLETSEQFLISILGILKSGAAYVPLDVKAPLERKNHQIKETNITVIITDTTHMFDLEFYDETLLAIDVEFDEIDTEKEDLFINLSKPTQVAYVIFTSGSTGVPKGVMISHKNLLDYTCGLIEKIKLDSNAYNYGLMSTLSADLGNTVVFGALTTGGSLHLFSKEYLVDFYALQSYFKENALDFIKIVPSHWESLSSNTEMLLPNKGIIFGGEKLTSKTIKKIKSETTKLTIINHYGPTETTIGKLMYQIDFNEIKNQIPIGKPFSNTKIYILDESLSLVPIGIPGELYIGGEGVSLGYINRDELTKERFISNPFSPKETLYKTGDLAYWLEDGNVQFVGRNDDQLKVRGYRVEPKEIEITLEKLKEVEKAVVTLIKSNNDSNHLVAYLILDNGVQIDKNSIKKRLEVVLPDYMIPTLFEKIEKVPLTSNGKIDYKDLQLRVQEVKTNVYIAPKTDTEKSIVEIWKEVLKEEKIGLKDNFFELRGDSLSAIRLIASYKKRFRKTITIMDIFDNPVLESQVEMIETTSIDTNSEIQKVTLASSYPMSNAQYRMWVLCQWEQASIAYNKPYTHILNGDYDLVKFKKTIKAVINRHEILRTVFKENNSGEIHQFVLPENELNFQLGYKDYRKDKEAVQEFMNLDILTPFDLEKGPMFRAWLLQVEDDEYILYYCMHHIISDGKSMEVLSEDILTYYDAFSKNIEPNIEPLQIQYKDYSVWQINQYNSISNEHKKYWIDLLKDDFPVLDLPLSKTRPKIKTYSGSAVVHTIAPDIVNKLRTFTVKEDGSLFAALMAVWNVLLHKYTGESNLTLGFPVSGRAHKELENQIGLYFNVLVLRNEINVDDDFTVFFQKIKKSILESYKHQDYPFDKLVEELNVGTDLSRSPIFDILINYHGKTSGTLELTDTPKSLGDCMVKYDVEIDMSEISGGVQIILKYNNQVYESTMIERFVSHFNNLLLEVLNHQSKKIADLNYLSHKESIYLVEDLNDTEVVFSENKTIVDFIEIHAKNTPNNIAIQFEESRLTCQELEDRSNQIANFLYNKGVTPKTLLPVCMKKSIDMIPTLLGIMKLGAAYVPITPDYPKDRIDFILEDSNASYILTDHHIYKELNFSTLNVHAIYSDDIEINNETTIINSKIPSLSIDELAYVIYTSGSSGKPKGVKVEYSSLMNFLFSMRDTMNWNSSLSFLSLTTFTFDISILEFFAPLILGGKLIMINDDNAKDPEYITEIIQKEKPNCIQATPSHWSMLLEEEWGLDTNIQLLSGGEALPEYLKEKLLDRSNQVWNLYGPTETTIWSCMFKLKKNQKVLIGKPIANTQVYILNEEESLVPVGCIGELCIGGEGLSLGYLNREELTRETFIDNPFKTNSKLYKTGDLARWLPSGNIEFIGRKDYQVKINGYRIELGEIEIAINNIKNIEQTLVTVHEDITSQTKNLVAYIVCDNTLDTNEVQAILTQKLPIYMVPKVYVKLEKMPLTQNGKIDRKNLPNPKGDSYNKRKYLAPVSELEQRIVSIWQDVLNIEKIGLNDHFFELGGNSLSSIKLISKYQKAFNKKVTINKIFNTPVLKEQISLIKDSKHILYREIPKLPELGSYSISNAQNRLWVLSQFKGSNASYNLPSSIFLNGDYNIQHFKKSMMSVLGRHEILRTVFRENTEGTVEQIVLNIEEIGFKIDQKDYSLKEAPIEKAKLYIKEDSYKPFDLENGPLLRVSLIKVSKEKYIFYFNMHHIISDGWSMKVLKRDILSFYNHHSKNIDLQLPKLRIQYKDYAAWQQIQLNTNEYEQHKNYWVNRFSGTLPLINLPSYKHRPNIKTYNGRHLSFYINSEIIHSIKKYVEGQKGTLFMFLLSSLNTLLHRYTGEEEIIIGCPIAGRDHSDLEDQIGFYTNTLALKTNITGDLSFNELYDTVKGELLEAYNHQVYPFDKIVEELNLRRDTSRNALFDILLVLQNADNNEQTLKGVNEKIGVIKDHGEIMSRFDIEFNFREEGEVLRLDLTYNTDVYDYEMITSFIQHYQNLIKSVIEEKETKVSELNYLQRFEEYKLLLEYNNTNVNYTDEKTVVDLFEEQVFKSPNTMALVDKNNKLTYKEVDELSNQLAHRLLDHVINDEYIGVILERSIDSVISMLAIMKLGKVYVPIDMKYPLERIEFILKDSRITHIISDETLEITQKLNSNLFKIVNVKLPKENYNFSRLNQSNITENAFVIYTSGSTGVPKGVIQTHRMLRNLINWDFSVAKVKRNLKCLHYSSFSFDVSLQDVYGALVNGGELHIISDKLKLDFISLKDYIVQESIEVLAFPYAAMIGLFSINTPSDFVGNKIKQIISAGEQLKLTDDLNTFLDSYSSIDLYNHYGPSETHVVTNYKYQKNNIIYPNRKDVLIGKPINNTTVYILNESKQLQPTGVIGEIYIGGFGLAHGYLNQKKLTEERFIESPFKKEELIYMTGDLGRWYPDGNVEFIGRKDDQVKIRGYRIELGEIEATLDRVEAIKQSVVIVKEAVNGNKQLIAYVVSEEEIDVQKVRDYLHEKLPSYMIPNFYIPLKDMPLNSNGKVDRKALPSPENSISNKNKYIAPSTETELQLVRIWEEILDIEKIGIKDHFFELGGNSLDVIKVVSKIRKELNVELDMEVLFQFSKIDDLAFQIDFSLNQKGMKTEYETLNEIKL